MTKIQAEHEKEKRVILIRVSETLAKKMEAIAKDLNASLNKACLVALEHFVKKHGK